MLDYCLPAGEAHTTAAREVLDRSLAAVTAETIADAMYTWRIGARILYITGRIEPMRQCVEAAMSRATFREFPSASVGVSYAIRF